MGEGGDARCAARARLAAACRRIEEGCVGPASATPPQGSPPPRQSSTGHRRVAMGAALFTDRRRVCAGCGRRRRPCAPCSRSCTAAPRWGARAACSPSTTSPSRCAPALLVHPAAAHRHFVARAAARRRQPSPTKRSHRGALSSAPASRFAPGVERQGPPCGLHHAGSASAAPASARRGVPRAVRCAAARPTPRRPVASAAPAQGRESPALLDVAGLNWAAVYTPQRLRDDTSRYPSSPVLPAAPCTTLCPTTHALRCSPVA